MLAAFKRLFVEWNGGVCPSDSVGESEYGNALSLVGSIEAYRMQQPAIVAIQLVGLIRCV